jgi:hypothetical protein
MSTLSVGSQADDPDLGLGTIPERCAAADAAEVWRLARAWHGAGSRSELVDAALALADELGRRREARRAMARVATRLRASPGGREVSARLKGTDVVFRAQAAAGDAALAVFLVDHLSPDVRDALAAPWASVHGSPFAGPADAIAEGTSA